MPGHRGNVAQADAQAVGDGIAGAVLQIGVLRRRHVSCNGRLPATQMAQGTLRHARSARSKNHVSCRHGVGTQTEQAQVVNALLNW